ncbi:MAG: hypothetical protein JWQ97_4068 [Phenylobacterium sp.]|nr:hypothetical protein [Phenylobacterium sp.]
MAEDIDRAARRPRLPVIPEEGLHEGHYREILALIRGLDGRVTEIREDAREARDAATRLTERFGAQDIPTKLAELRGDVEKGFAGARADLVNSMDKITRETRSGLDALETRVATLEGFKNRIEGAGGVFGWLSKNAPWLLAMLMTAAAAMGLKDKLP